MSRIVRLTESDLTRIVRRVVNEQNEQLAMAAYQKISPVIGTAINRDSEGVHASRDGFAYFTFDCNTNRVTLNQRKIDVSKITGALQDYCKYTA